MDSLLAKVRSIDPMSILEDDGSQNLEDLKLDSSEYQYHAEDLIRLLSVEKEINIVEALTAILLALRQDTVDDIQRLNLLLSSELHPILIPANGPPSRGAEALVSLKIILQMVKFHKVINPALLVPVIAYMDPCDDWNSHRLNALTLEILKSYVQNGGCIEEVMDLVLSQVIRPAISSIGLKQRTTSLATLQDHSTDRPWHNRGFFLRRMYEWILATCSPEYAANHWSQLLPFVLNLLDDTDIPSRTSGLRYSIIVVNKLPHQIILINGIGQVIWDAVFPVISIMPGVYPEHEVIQVVELAYASLACIASKNDQQKKMALLDKMLREGVFTNYSHASQYSSMIELFLREMATITDAMGIHAVKHLKVSE
ncbi:hypothetical protein CFIMG_006765RA [Ceratocystis fimbriata CBS 114723]|uniref:Uncharacterized protein n=1 Tax=Ceratocystis fimbriata CBS 114723 TaxID=1035309 RepID=A0A2C5WU45_9PEZI|nr:hypothetical protein CFIMG_006765RA [Ceratocystis fimbriata CBS 114723]